MLKKLNKKHIERLLDSKDLNLDTQIVLITKSDLERLERDNQAMKKLLSEIKLLLEKQLS